MCGQIPYKDSDMTLDQIEKLGQQLRERKEHIDKIKVVGGEPLVHPQYQEIIEKLNEFRLEGLITFIKINTNKLLPRPAFDFPVRYLGGLKGGHIPFQVSPADLGVKTNLGCAMPIGCGYSLDAWGFLPCSPAIALVRVFKLYHLYKRELPTGPWGYEEICKHCVFACDWKWTHVVPRFDRSGMVDGVKIPSPAFERGMAEYVDPDLPRY